MEIKISCLHNSSWAADCVRVYNLYSVYTMWVGSTCADENIFHLLAFDIIPNFRPAAQGVVVADRALASSTPCGRWRDYVLGRTYARVAPEGAVDARRVVPAASPPYECWKFIDYKPNRRLIKLYRRICLPRVPPSVRPLPLPYILLNQRSTDRILLDRGGTRLGSFLHGCTLPLPLIECDFGSMSPQQQHDACTGCATLISAHGAGCTNLVFTRPRAPLVEVNFRRGWHCDPVCDDHFHGRIGMMDRCRGELTYRPEFHKADYHNLCKLVGKEYREVECVDYGGGFLSRNPISRKLLFVDGKSLVKLLWQLGVGGAAS